MRTRFLQMYAAVSLAVVVVLGAVVGHQFGGRVADRARHNAVEQVQTTIDLLLAPRLTGKALNEGLPPELNAELRDVFTRASLTSSVKNVLLWNRRGEIVFQTFAPGDIPRRSALLARALAGRVSAEVITVTRPVGSGLRGRYLEAFLPVRIDGARVDAALEADVDYSTVEAMVRADRRSTLITLLLGLGALWALLFRLVFAVSQQIRAKAADNERLSRNDQLTGLANRVGLQEIAARRIAETLARSQHAALILIDLDRFKEINDTLGHAHGDLVLTEIGPRLAGVLGVDDVIARVGGDEFAILLSGLDSPDQADLVAQRAMDAFHEPFVVAEIPLIVEASFGVVAAPEHGRTFEELLQHADVAMYRAKARHGGVQRYDASFDRRSVDRLALLAELQQAIESDELVVYFQPKFDLGKQRFTGVEALVRWPHATRGLVPPGDFIPQAEGSGLIRPLTRLVMRKSLAQLAQWRANGLDVSMSINVSARNLLDPSLCDDVRLALSDAGVEASRVILEITETAVMADPERSIELLRELSAMGLGLSVDDFGIGHSSMAYLKRLPVSELKIDRAFVSKILEDRVDEAIVRTTVELGRTLGLKVVAEGVESGDVLVRLAELGCEGAQGYYLGAPMPGDQIESILRVPFVAMH